MHRKKLKNYYPLILLSIVIHALAIFLFMTLHKPFIPTSRSYIIPIKDANPIMPTPIFDDRVQQSTPQTTPIQACITPTIIKKPEPSRHIIQGIQQPEPVLQSAPARSQRDERIINELIHDIEEGSAKADHTTALKRSTYIKEIENDNEDDPIPSQHNTPTVMPNPDIVQLHASQHTNQTPAPHSTLCDGIKEIEHAAQLGIIRRSAALKRKRKKSMSPLLKKIRNFTDHVWNQKENSWIASNTPEKKPSFEEFKYMSYEDHLSHCLQVSWRRNILAQSSDMIRNSNAAVEFTIDQNGNLLNVQMLQSSGSSDIDTLILKNVRLASPYPPLPKHFACNAYTTRRNINIIAH